MRKVNTPSKKNTGARPPFHLGSRLCALRSARKLTLDGLSRMAGVSKAMLSQIEQDKVNPTVAVVFKIARALQVSMGELLAAPEQQNILRVIVAGEESYTYRSDPSCTIRTLSPLTLEKAIEFYRVAFEASGELVSEPHFPGTEEILHVAKGRLAVTSGGQEAEVGKGDSIHYRADVAHALRNVGAGRAEAYLIVRYREE